MKCAESFCAQVSLKCFHRCKSWSQTKPDDAYACFHHVIAYLPLQCHHQTATKSHGSSQWWYNVHGLDHCQRKGLKTYYSCAYKGRTTAPTWLQLLLAVRFPSSLCCLTLLITPFRFLHFAKLLEIKFLSCQMQYSQTTQFVSISYSHSYIKKATLKPVFQSLLCYIHHCWVLWPL